MRLRVSVSCCCQLDGRWAKISAFCVLDVYVRGAGEGARASNLAPASGFFPYRHPDIRALNEW